MNRNNIHKRGYDFDLLQNKYPAIIPYIITTKDGKQSINFADPKAVKILNTALLFTHYQIKYWHFSDEHLCPAIPGRVDYIHYLNDLLDKEGIKNPTILDIGTGASVIYPLLGQTVAKWKFVATDITQKTLEQAQKIIKTNKLDKFIKLRHQTDKSAIFKGIIKKTDSFAASMCNPPFYSSLEEANKATSQKLKGLAKSKKTDIAQDNGLIEKKIQKPQRNFSGKNNELWYKGGEKAFVHNYLYESSFYKDKVNWFSILVSNKKNIKSMQLSLEKLGATSIKTIPMQHGNKITRIVAWTFL
jgi:23S rRNA (adenine1618-N6)-methyltransferase